ncbi:peptidoglycan editing factor PgeF [Patescibacteria group bacterium]|nr:peptidoglycan editing factor PgeF [Patescibacteria group bacterium]MBU1473205.1 peptidoglycan editing factor PgeF [Patescibacteria group bacterium]
MLSKTKSEVYQSTLLSSISGVVHGYTDRILGDMKKNPQNRQKVLDGFFSEKVKLITAEQVHGGGVALVNDATVSYFPGVDGLVYKHKSGEVVALGVFVADCVPMLLVDPKAEIIAAVHAGWKGTLLDITSKTVCLMKSLGGLPRDIVASIGPHIGMCCYDVGEERAKMFQKAFGNDRKIVSITERAWHLDLGMANRKQLLDSGVLIEHIDAPPVCTSCLNNKFFSYRKDSSETFGEMLGLIGYR